MHGDMDSFLNNMFGDNHDNEWQGNPERPEEYYEEDTIVNEQDVTEEEMKMAKVDTLNRVADVTCDLEDAICDHKSTINTFKSIKMQLKYISSMMLEDYENGSLEEDVIIQYGKDINRCNKICERYIAKCVNF